MAAEHARLMDELASPEVASDHQRSAELGKRVSEIGEAVRLYEEWTAASEEIAEAREMLRDATGEDEEFLATTLAEAEATVDVGSRRGSANCSARAIHATTSRSSSRSGPAPAATKRRCSPATSCACTSGTPSATR